MINFEAAKIGIFKPTTIEERSLMLVSSFSQKAVVISNSFILTELRSKYDRLIINFKLKNHRYNVLSKTLPYN